MKFEDFYFAEFKFTDSQIKKNLRNALRDLGIAEKDEIPDVKFNYAYVALIKAGITLISLHNVKIKNVPGHHVKIIEKMAEILNDEYIISIGNAMRSKRNIDFYGGGVEVTEKECEEYIKFVRSILRKAKDKVSSL